MLDINAIKELLPHRYPFLLVDRIIRIEENKKIIGIKNVTLNEQFFQGHFPEFPIMPGVLIIEAMAQVSGILAARLIENKTNKVMYFMGIDQAKFRRPVVPGDRLRLELELLKQRKTIFRFQGYAYVEENLVAEAQLQAMLGEKPSN